jgi:hypothetical protein
LITHWDKAIGLMVPMIGQVRQSGGPPIANAIGIGRASVYRVWGNPARRMVVTGWHSLVGAVTTRRK